MRWLRCSGKESLKQKQWHVPTCSDFKQRFLKMRSVHIDMFAILLPSLVVILICMVDLFLVKHDDSQQPKITPHLTVCKLGPCDFSTITAAVAASPNYSTTHFRIYIMEGVYHELVRIGKEKRNLFFMGDGIGSTIVSFNRSEGTGWRAEDTATMWVKGDGFIAQDITFRNAANGSEGQAVALCNEAHRSAFYRVSIEGYHGTLNARSSSQFYRESSIYGAVDVVFGDATAVFQSCVFYLREPLAGHSIVLTAQARLSRFSHTGFCIHNCQIMAAQKLAGSDHAYLGRPSGKYARVVIMQSFIDRLIDSQGWLHGEAAEREKAKWYFGEYNNTGPGADETRRQHQSGVSHVMESVAEASKYTVASFLEGDAWIPQTTFPYTPHLV